MPKGCDICDHILLLIQDTAKTIVLKHSQQKAEQLKKKKVKKKKRLKLKKRVMCSVGIWDVLLGQSNSK